MAVATMPSQCPLVADDRPGKGKGGSTPLALTRRPMKKASEIVAEMRFASENDHKIRAASLRRLAGGLRSQVSEWGVAGFSEKERLVLLEAASLLEAAAEQAVKAASLAKLKEQNRVDRSVKLKPLVKAHCDKLADVADKLAFVCAVDEFLLDGLNLYPGRLVECVQRAADKFADSLSYEDSEVSPEERVAQAFEGFNKGKARTMVRHGAAIGKVLEAFNAMTLAQAAVDRAKNGS